MIAAARLPARSDPANSPLFLLCRIQHKRNNGLFCWAELGAKYVGIAQSLIATCRLHDIDPYIYLVDVLQRVGQHPAT